MEQGFPVHDHRDAERFGLFDLFIGRVGLCSCAAAGAEIATVRAMIGSESINPAKGLKK
ncbi:hypothetical protein SL1157_2447 [Ruegeria lacuscaerulensis ITI-1157]|nr:hypothetical protein SL1157_2447 [Ruegeria lacuscaerulensis ITI-1157]